MVEFDTSPFHVSLSNIFKRNLRLPWLRIHHQNWLYEYNSWVGKFGILCTTDQANVFFFQLFFPKSLSSYIRILSALRALLPTTSLEFEFYWAVRFLPISANVNKHWKTRVKDNDVITKIDTDRYRCSNSRDVVATEFSFLFPPLCHSAPESLLAG